MTEAYLSDEPLHLFSDDLKITRVAHTDPERMGDPKLIGKREILTRGR